MDSWWRDFLLMWLGGQIASLLAIWAESHNPTEGRERLMQLAPWRVAGAVAVAVIAWPAFFAWLIAWSRRNNSPP